MSATLNCLRTRNLTHSTLSLSAFLVMLTAASQPSLCAVHSITNNQSVGATLDLDPAKTYTHKLDFHNDGLAATVNGVNFGAVNSGAGVDPNTGNAYSLTAPNATNFGGGTSSLLAEFVFNSGVQPAGSVETLTLGGLTPGETYEARLYYRNFGSRPNTVSFNDGAGTTILGTQDQATASSENYHAIRYRAEAATVTMTFAQEGTTASWHQYAVTNEVADVSGTYLISGLYNTGVDNNGVALADDAIDSHYTLNGGNAVVATSAGGFPIGPWLADAVPSAWITPAANASGPGGSATYRTTFTLPDVATLDTATISGEFAADNAVLDVLLNGQSLGLSTTGFTAFNPFTIPTHSPFVHGVNTLDFVVFNGNFPTPAAGPTGLRVRNLSGSFLATIPEPSTFVLFAVGLVGVLGATRRGRARQVASMFAVCLVFAATLPAQAVVIGPGKGISDAGDVDTPNLERLNVDRTRSVVLPAGTYNVNDFGLRVNTENAGAGGAGTISAMLLSGAPANYTTIWVSPDFDPTSNGVQSVSYTAGTQQFTLGAETTVYGGVFTKNQGSAIIGLDANNSGSGSSTTDHDGDGYTAPTGAGENVSGFSHTLGRTYAFELNVTDVAPLTSASIGPGEATMGGSADGTGGRTNVEKTFVTLEAGTYNVEDFEFWGVNTNGTVQPFLAELTSVGQYTPIWAGAIVNPAVGTNTDSYVLGSEQFTLTETTEVFAGFAMTSNAVGYFGGGATDHNGSPALTPIVGVEFATFSNNNLGRSYSFGINVSQAPPAAAPEPSTVILATMGLAGLAMGRRRKQR